MIYIYALLNGPHTIFYVGQTIDPMRRLRTHQRYYGTNIILKVLQEVEDQKTANSQERAWIEFYDHFYQLENKRYARTAWVKERQLEMERYRTRIS